MTDTPKQPATEGGGEMSRCPHKSADWYCILEAGHGDTHVTEMTPIGAGKLGVDVGYKAGRMIEAEAAAGLLALREALDLLISRQYRETPASRRAQQVLSDTALAAAEIEARIRAEAWAEFRETYPNTVDLTDRARAWAREQPATEEAE